MTGLKLAWGTEMSDQTGEGGTEDGAQLVECLLNIQEALGLSQPLPTTRHGGTFL